jgi:nucleoside-diphosphate-sugar epimerase
MIFVTGATGLLGSHLLYELALLNRPIRALFRDEEKKAFVKKVFGFYHPEPLELFKRVEWFQGDINDQQAISEAIKGVKQVFHIAGFVSFNDRDKKRLTHVNAGGTACIVNACLEAGNIKLCHVSSIATLGELAPNELINEEVIWNRGTAASAYAISKFRAEMEVWRGIHEGLNAVIVNPSVIIGPGLWDSTGNHLFQSILKGLNYYTLGSSGYVDVRDVARIMVSLMDNDISGERFILNAENISHQKLINLMCIALNRALPKIAVAPWMTGGAVILEKIRAVLTGSGPRINRRILEIAAEKNFYSNKKITDTLHVKFMSVEESVNSTVKLFNKEQP